MDFSAWVVSGLMLVAGIDLADRLQRRRPARGHDARLRAHPRARAGAEDGDGLSAAGALPHRRDAGDVHARGVHDRRRCDHVAARSCARSTTSTPSAAGSTSRPRWRPRARCSTPAPPSGARSRPPSRSSRTRPSYRLEWRRRGAGKLVEYPLRGFDDSFLNTTTFDLAATAKGYGSPHDVWQALSRHADLAVVDALAAPRRSNWNFGAPPALRLNGFYIEDTTFDPVDVVVRDPAPARPGP